MSDVKRAVILAKPEYLQVPLMARAIAAFQKIPVPDAAVQAKRKWGIIAENLSEADAARLCEELSKAGAAGISVEQESLASLPSPQPVQRIFWRPDGISIRLEKEARSISWEDLSLIAAAGIKSVTSRTVKIKEGPNMGQKMASLGIMMATGLPISIGPKSREVEKKEETVDLIFFFDLFTKDAMHYRIDAQNIDFSFLEERKLYGLFPNFRVLVTDVAKLATQAARNRGLQIILESKPITSMGYDSLDDFDVECRWLRTLAAIPR